MLAPARVRPARHHRGAPIAVMAIGLIAVLGGCKDGNETVAAPSARPAGTSTATPAPTTAAASTPAATTAAGSPSPSPVPPPAAAAVRTTAPRRAPAPAPAPAPKVTLAPLSQHVYFTSMTCTGTYPNYTLGFTVHWSDGHSESLSLDQGYWRIDNLDYDYAGQGEWIVDSGDFPCQKPTQ